MARGWLHFKEQHQACCIKGTEAGELAKGFIA